MKIIKKRIDEMERATYNPRVDLMPGDEEFQYLEESMRRFGQVLPIVWNQRTNRVVSGHQRLSVLEYWGEEKAEVSVVDLDEIKEKGKLAALSLKPRTPASVILPYLDKLDMVLVMTVEPGFGGQSFMADMLPKIRGIRALMNEYKPGCELEVDGGIDENTAPLVVDAGANVLVAGSAVFGRPDRAAAIEGLRMAAAIKP